LCTYKYSLWYICFICVCIYSHTSGICVYEDIHFHIFVLENRIFWARKWYLSPESIFHRSCNASQERWNIYISPRKSLFLSTESISEVCIYPIVLAMPVWEITHKSLLMSFEDNKNEYLYNNEYLYRDITMCEWVMAHKFVNGSLHTTLWV